MKHLKEETRYYSNGRIKFERIVNDENGSWAEYTYDETGNKLTYKNSYGFSSEGTYDKNGNPLTLLDSDGYFTEWTYGEDGNTVSTKRFF